MKIKKFLKGLCIFYIASCCELVLAQAERCFFEPYSDGVEVAHIGDRQIYTLFTEHATNIQKNKILDALDTINNNLLYTAGVLNTVIEEHREIMESEQSDIPKIRRLVGSEQINWVGVEDSPEEFYGTGGFTDMAEVFGDYSRGSRMSLARNAICSSKTDMILSLLFRPITVTYVNYPTIFDQVSIVPLDNYNLRREFDEILQEGGAEVVRFSNFSQQKLREGTITRHQYDLLAELFPFSREEEESLNSNENFENFVNTFLTAGKEREVSIYESESLPFPIPIPRLFSSVSLSPTPTEAETLMILKSLVDRGKISLETQNGLIRERDQHVVQSVLSQPGNGLILFGSAHGPGIKEGLTTACQNSL